MPNNPTFTQMRGVFPHWSAAQLAAYRYGTGDPEGEDEEYMDPQLMEHYNHYLRGRADQIGDAAMYEDWFIDNIPDWRVDARWWL